MFRTITAYEPTAAPVHPGGAGSGGAMEAVTPCLLTNGASGLALAVAARARIAREYCIVLVIRYQTKHIGLMFWLMEDEYRSLSE